jgi:hypothetical protein
VINRIMFGTMNTMKALHDSWPTHPSQVVVMMRLAGMACSLPDDSPDTVPTADQKRCLDPQIEAIDRAIIIALRDYIINPR